MLPDAPPPPVGVVGGDETRRATTNCEIDRGQRCTTHGSASSAPGLSDVRSNWGLFTVVNGRRRSADGLVGLSSNSCQAWRRPRPLHTNLPIITPRRGTLGYPLQGNRFSTAMPRRSQLGFKSSLPRQSRNRSRLVWQRARFGSVIRRQQLRGRRGGDGIRPASRWCRGG